MLGFKDQIVSNRLLAGIGVKFLKFANISKSKSLAPYEIVSDPEANYREPTRKYFMWVMRPEAQAAFGAALKKREALGADEPLSEGTLSERINKHYERNPKIRGKVLSQKGFLCEVCGFDFFRNYGRIGKGFAEVHHVRPLSGGHREVQDVEKDFLVLCSNCHSMIHRRNPPFSKDALKRQLNS